MILNNLHVHMGAFIIKSNSCSQKEFVTVGIVIMIVPLVISAWLHWLQFHLFATIFVILLSFSVGTSVASADNTAALARIDVYMYIY